MASSTIVTSKFEYDYIFKLMLIGDSAVGKTCLMLRFSERSVPFSYAQTIGIDFRVRTVAIDGQLVKLQIWDTAGQERFRTITSACYRGAAGVVFVFDLTKRSSFSSIRSWVHSFEKHMADKAVVKFLVGNKCDLAQQQEVSTSDAEQLAESLDATYFETSALKDVNVDGMFIALAKRLIGNAIKAMPPMSPLKTVALSLKKAELSRRGCCS